MAQALQVNLNRSSESIRDRIKRYLSKISPSDEDKIVEAAKVIYNSIQVQLF
jgi:hypothetical protein